MKLSYIAPTFALVLTIAACSSSTEPQTSNPVDTTVVARKPEGPSIRRDYDAARGGVQITRIYYDQKANFDSTGLEDEWIVLESNTVVNTAGWTLNAGDAGQNYPLRNPLNRKLILYTHTIHASLGDDTTQWLGISPGRWIWNNSEPDTAWIFDANHNVIDSLSYKN
jgi:hypothetical protein